MSPDLRSNQALRRLRWPLVTGLAGVLFAAAWLISGGGTWWFSILAVVVTAVRAIALYRSGGSDSDEGALAGSRADERQRMVSTRSLAMAGGAAIAASFTGLTVSVAARSAGAWPFLIMLLVAGFGYLLGLSSYGADTPEPAGETGAAVP